MVDYFSELLNFIKKDEFILNIIISLIWLVVIFLIKWSIYGRITQSHSLSKIEKVNIKEHKQLLISGFILYLNFYMVYTIAIPTGFFCRCCCGSSVGDQRNNNVCYWWNFNKYI